MDIGGVPAWYVIDEIDLAGLAVDHAGLARLCDELEALADSLPTIPDEALIRHLRFELENRLPTHDAKEKATLHRLFGHRPGSPIAATILDHIGARRASCVVQSQDLVAAFRRDAAVPEPETLGYMIRCFFQACRQGMAFEELSILHLADARLTPAARAVLADSLSRSCC